jgi:hypothetical protein
MPSTREASFRIASQSKYSKGVELLALHVNGKAGSDDGPIEARQAAIAQERQQARALILGELRAPTAARDTLRSVTAHRSCGIEGTWASVYVRFEGSLVSSELLHGGRSSLRSPRQRIKSNESPSANEWVYLDTITIIHCGGFPAQLTINQY